MRTPQRAIAHALPRRALLLGALTCALLLLLGGGPPGARSQEVFREYDIKAAYLYNLPQFIEWPDDAVDSRFLTLCIVGHDPFGPVLDFLAGKQAEGRPLRVRRLESGAEPAGCPVVFVSASEAGRMAPLLRSLYGAAVLTVGETDDFTRLGGVVRFFVGEERVHLEINITAAQSAGLSISAKLLSLASVVRYPPPGERT
ncbi:MAG: YfiR family protein [Deltaproteobacteria bacterium]|jgi:hypothetical protein|nr:YfiR family protein [Deltaproteobacteria bacterium]